MLEDESVGETTRTTVAVPSPALALPASLNASLMARLDRLGPAKEVAQIGAAIGREFSHALLASVARKPETELGSALDRLIEAGLLPARRCHRTRATCSIMPWCKMPPTVSCCANPDARFTPTSPRCSKAKLRRSSRASPNCSRHCTEAGLIEKAASLWAKAGQRSLERSALIEAVEQFGRALSHNAKLPSTPARRREEINVRVGLANALKETKVTHRPRRTRRSIRRAC